MESCSQPTVSLSKLGAKCARGKRRFIRIPSRWLAVAGIGFGVAAGISVCLAGNFAQVLARQARDAYIVHRLTEERDALAINNELLQREMLALKKDNSKEQGFESLVQTRLNELQTIIESSTSIKLFKDKKGRNKSVVVAKDSGNSTGLAALLESPALRSRTDKKVKEVETDLIDQLRELNQGLGGAEVECRRSPAGKIVCATSVDTKEASTDPEAVRELTSLEAEATQVVPDAEQWSGEQRTLLERLTHYTTLLRSLPIGTPVEGELTSHFGRRASPFSGRSSFHEGLDISLNPGSKVQVTGDGVVSKVEYDGTYGWVVDVTHTHDITTRYAHLSKVLVKEGRRVRRGDLLAYSGSSGRSTGPHLHYEVRVRGLAKNPMPFLALVDRLHKFL